MNSHRLLCPRLAAVAAVATAASLAWALAIRRRIALADSAHIHMDTHATLRLPPDMLQTAVRTVNPRGHRSASADWSTCTLAGERVHEAADEALLAKFVQGYFGGAVMAPERGVLRTFGRQLVHFQDIQPTEHVWSASELAKTTLPPLHTVVFGTFLVIGREVGEKGHKSYIDFAFGSDKSMFAGVHRVVLERRLEDDVDDVANVDGDEGHGRPRVLVHLLSMACNPSADRAVWPAWLHAFHKVYQSLLFREGVSEMRRWLDERA